jgi:iron-sulfur cluster assembly accessory protein
MNPEIEPSSVRLSDTAARRIADILAAEAPGTLLRVTVEGGGCSGFQYKFDLVKEREADDVFIERGEAKVVIDSTSLPFVEGSEIDFVDDLIGAHFQVNNPNASASCGCGTSFSI